MLTFDYETEGIVGNPIYRPPRPVGVSIKHDDGRSKYWAWGHPTNNNCTWEEGKAALLTAMRHHKEWLAHNAPFEAAISKKYFGAIKGNPLNFHDSQYLIYLFDPYAFSFSLKPSAERILGVAPDEQTELRDWILSHVPGSKMSNWGAFICLAPGDLVGRYAEGDTDRTYDLYQHLRPKIEEQGMWPAYQREQRLMPVLFKSSQMGVRLDTKRLSDDIVTFTAAKKCAEDYIHRALGDFNIDSDAELAGALERADQVTEWVLTPTGKRSTARKNLAGRVRDPDLLTALAYRGVLSTCLGTFAEPWLAQAMSEGGRVHPQWNQVRGDRGTDGDVSGTRTGRMSCKGPNLQNPPNDFEELVIPGFIKEYFASIPWWDGPQVMHLRSYLLPEVGHRWIKRDFSAQEMRIMAHYAEGRLYEAFKKDPTTDPHVAVQAIIKEHAGIELSRKHVKITGFGIIYGRGIANLSIALGVDPVQGKATRDAYFAALPEAQELSRAIKRVGSSGGFITTWGGRRYYREPNPERDMSYKLLNYLIQGSAADQTKECIIEYDEAKNTDDVFLAAVHDEMNASAPEECWEDSMRRMREVMDADRFDVPFRSEGYSGPNWADIKGCA